MPSSAINTTAPSVRRKGFTPQPISMMAHVESAMALRTAMNTAGMPAGWAIRRTAVRTMNTHKGAFGNWARVTLPVMRLRKNQLAKELACRAAFMEGSIRLVFVAARRVALGSCAAPYQLAPNKISILTWRGIDHLFVRR